MGSAVETVPKRIAFFVGIVIGGVYAVNKVPIQFSFLAGLIGGLCYFFASITSLDFKREIARHSSGLYWILFFASTGTAYFSGIYIFGHLLTKGGSIIERMLISSFFQGGVAGFVAMIIYEISRYLTKPSRRSSGKVPSYVLPPTSPNDVPELLSVLTDVGASSGAKALARAKLERVGPDSEKFVGDMGQALDNENIKKSRAALTLLGALGNTKSTKAIPYLIKALDTFDSEAHEKALWSLTRIAEVQRIRGLGESKEKSIEWWDENKQDFESKE